MVKEEKRKIRVQANTNFPFITVEDFDTGAPVNDKNCLEMVNSIQKSLKDIGTDEIKKVEEALIEENATEIVDALIECKKISLMFSEENCKKLLEIMYKIHIKDNSQEVIKELYELKLYLGSRTRNYAELYDDINEYLKDFEQDLEPTKRLNLLLFKANSASQSNKKEVAEELYKKIIAEAPKENHTILAWAHRGLSICFEKKNKSFINNEKKTAELFLLAGNKNQYIVSQVKMADSMVNTQPEESIKILKDSIAILDPSNPFNREMIASLYLKLAKIHDVIGLKNEAKKYAEKAIDFRKNPTQIGNEQAIIATFYALEHYSENSNNQNIKEEIRLIEKQMSEDGKKENEIRMRLIKAINEENVNEMQTLKEKVIALEDIQFEIIYWIGFVSISQQSFHEKLEILNDMLLKTEKEDISDEIRHLLYSTFADIYLENKKEEKAIEWYKKALEIEPYSKKNRQNYVALLQKNRLWEESKEFIETEIKRHGKLPGISLAYGITLMELGRHGDAIEYFTIAEEKVELKELAEKCKNDAIEKFVRYNKQDIKIEKYPNVVVEDITLEKLKECLADFSEHIEKNIRMSFWQDSIDCKWISQPEQHGKNLLYTFIKARFGEYTETILEVSTGAGRIDIYLNFSNGFKTIIELKICGAPGYSKNYALEGIEQLEHYMKNKGVNVGFLVVFDSRKRDNKKGINNEYPCESKTIYSYVADVTPTIKHKK
ncbi:hypothetical protein MmiHf6_14370 [Methanimicrococcus hongohii]|uniref:Tetratricopeptide repeat protein n=1 Tax=Methanimicrococcus hongohii TaxID=3028295 RepID=A0AA96V320_9EURY|nr:PD-(D/E)XK nuclease domain-containing protein [Methanimicrococcus sp. Hf6]WNY24108.1 hypothetical protein MmiHf6_14370 [Methanimicrococcus sp. Hf6]